MERNFTGFESGGLGELRQGGTTPTIGLTVPATTPRSGTFRLQLATQGSTPNNLAIFPAGEVTGTTGTVTSGHKRVLLRLYLRIDSTTMPFGSSQIRVCGLGGEFDANGINVWMDAFNCITLKAGSGYPTTSGSGYNGVTPTPTPNTGALTAGVWYRLILDVDYNVSGGTPTVTTSVRVTTDSPTPALDATVSVTPLPVFSNDFMGKVTLSSDHNLGGFDPRATYSFDDVMWVAAANAEAVNPLALPLFTTVLPLPPTGVVLNQWETGTYTAVDEYPLDTASGSGGSGDVIQSVLGTGTTVTFSHALSAALGITGAVAVKVSLNARIIGAGTGLVNVTLSGVTTSMTLTTTYLDVGTGASLYGAVVWGDLPGPSFDAMTFGVVKQNGTQTTQIGNILVEYIPGTFVATYGTQIRGSTQIKPLTIYDAQVATAAAIKLSKLEKQVIPADGTVPFAADESMGGHKLTNVTDPASAQDAATKHYVDTQGFIRADGTIPFTADESMGSHKLTNVTDPVNPQDAATKAYVDAHAGGGGGGSVNSVFNETPGGAVNGSNTAFTTANTYPSGTLRVYQNGLRLVPADFTETGANTFTLTTAPITGTLLRVDYGGTGASMGSVVLLEQHTAATSAQLDFKTFINSSLYDGYLIECYNLIPDTDNVDLRLRCSTDGGVTFDTGTNYRYAHEINNTGAFQTPNVSSASAAYLQLAQNVDVVGTSGGFSASMRLQNPSDPAHWKQLIGQYCYLNNDNQLYNGTLTGWYASTTAVNAIRFFASSGNLLSGTIRLYGIAKTTVTAMSPGQMLLHTQTGSASASLNVVSRNVGTFTGAIFQSDYDEYLIELVNLLPATNAVTFLLRVSTDGGATYDSGANYATALFRWSKTGQTVSGSATDTGIGCTVSQINVAADGGLCGSFRICNPLSASMWKLLFGSVIYQESTTPELLGGEIRGAYKSATAVTAFQGLYSAGNIASGTLRVYGLTKS